MNTNFPENLYSYYTNNSSEFEQKGNSQKKTLYYILAGACLLLTIKPNLIPVGGWIVRIAAIIGIIAFVISAFLITSDYYNKKSGGKINTLPVKKFDSTQCDEETILNMFNNNDFENIAKAPTSQDQPIQLYIHEDTVGKTFYLQIMKYFSESEFKGISEVKVLSGSDYTKFNTLIKDTAQ